MVDSHSAAAFHSTETPVVFVVDDDDRIRESLIDLLSAAGFSVFSFSSGKAFLKAEKPDAPACLVLDLALPDLSGLDVQRELGATSGPPIVFITGQSDVSSTVRAMKAGAVEFLSKPFNDAELLRAVGAAIERDRADRQARAEVTQLQGRYKKLTPREREILPFVIAGFANKETGAELGTSEITIGVHRSQLMRKMEARSLAELIRLADKLGIRPQDFPPK